MKIKENLYLFIFLLFVFTISLSQYLSVRLLLITCLLTFFSTNIREAWGQFIRHSWTSIFYLSLLTIGLLYSEDLATGTGVLETSASLILIPIAFSGLGILTQKKIQTLLFSFIAGVTLACIICLSNAIVSFYQTADPNVFLFYRLTEVINSQPTYLAYYLCFSIGTLLYLLYYYYEEIKLSKKILVILVFFLFIILMLTAGRTAYISMILVFSFFILKYLFEEERVLGKNIVFAVTLFLVLVMLLVNHFDFNTNNSSLEENSDYWERLTLWESAIKANPNIVTGVGTGDYKSVLNQYYLSHRLGKYADESLNSHNQFIQSLLSNGLVGLFSLFLLLARPIYLSIQSQQPIGILIFFPFLIYGMTEVFLGRYQGVVFFALLNQTFIIYYNYFPESSLK